MAMNAKAKGIVWAAVCLGLAALAAPITAPETPDVRRDLTVAVIEQVAPCVVNIATETFVPYHDFYDDLLTQFYGPFSAPQRQKRSIDLGSGVIIDEDGYLVTNSHVVRRASRIQVKLWDGREYDADPVWSIPGSDVALVKIRCKPGEKFKAIKFAADDDLLLGETVLALGNPYGLGNSVAKGILSSKNRRPSTGNEPLDVQDWLQTDASINPGNSGGPLVNLRGELIGLNVAVARGEGMGMGFSIPVKQISLALARCSAPEHTDGLWLGLQLKAGAGLPVVGGVQEGSPAAKAGLKEGDKIQQVNGEAPHNLIAFNRLVCASLNGQVSFTVLSGGERRTARVRMTPFQELVPQKLGLTIGELGGQQAQGLGLRGGGNWAIESVEKDGPADRVGLQRGFLILGVDGQSVADLRTVGEILCTKKPGETAQLTVKVTRRFGAGMVEFRQGTVDVPVR
jgi:S1-C subfamily serine protease